MSRLRNVQDACYDANFLILLLFDHKGWCAKTQLFGLMNKLEEFFDLRLNILFWKCWHVMFVKLAFFAVYKTASILSLLFSGLDFMILYFRQV